MTERFLRLRRESTCRAAVTGDAAGNIFVADGYENARIGKMAKNGKYLKSWGVKGSEAGQFNTPHSLAKRLMPI